MIRYLAATMLFAVAIVLAVPGKARTAEAAEAIASSAEPAATDRQILVLLRQVAAHSRGGTAYGGAYGDAAIRAARERIGRRIARENSLVFVGNWPMPLIGLDCLIMRVPETQSVEAAAAKVSRDANVEWAQPVQAFTTSGAAEAYNDPLFAVGPAARQWHLAELHRMATGKGVTVAVIDSQIEGHHPDLLGQIGLSKDFVIGRPVASEQHGTEVAGVIAAKANNGIGTVGIAPRARLMGLRACWQIKDRAGSVCDTLSLAKALHFAIERNVEIINLSLTGPPDALLGRLIDVALSRALIVVAAVDQRAPDGGFPASRTGVIAVSDVPYATLPRGVVSAPGRGIPTTQSRGRWYLVNGSSYATAHVSGLLALMRERPMSGKRGQSAFVLMPGGGAIDARATMQRAAKSCDAACKRQ